MSYLALLKMQATRVRDLLTGTDPYNNPIPAGTDEATYEAHLEQDRSGSSEQTVDEETQLSTYTLFLPAGADVLGGDRVEVEGVSYEVVGDPAIVRNPRLGTVHHVEARLRRVR